ncbi:tetratricopeptide repeat protein [uncultured Planktosalinus sp.]|uniref:tetratricopeptide repeat protein n=1 Tax=uncultured Planktosalinus sp. TaxID=1810935 RepID=UPI0030DBBFA3
MKSLYCCFCFLIFISISAQAQNHKSLAENYYALGNYSKAIQHLNQLPESKEQQLKLAKSYEQTGNLKNALAHYEKLFDRYPEDILLAYEYSKLLRKTAKSKQAEKILTTLIASDSLNPNFPYQMGLLKEQQSDSVAIEYFEKAYRLDQNHLPAAVKVITDKIKNKSFEQADTILTQTLKIDDTHFQLSNLKALNHFYQKDFHNAIVGYNKLLELNRPSENVYLKLGYAYAQVMDFEKSIEHYTIAINEYDDKNG